MGYKTEFKGLKVAIVHDWLVGLGGAERVVQSMLNLFPDADLYTSVYDPSKLGLFKGRKVHTTFLQKWPLAKKKHQLYAALRPLAFESFDFKGYDLVISSSSAEAKGVITPTETLHVSYIHTPIRYYWSGYEEYFDNPGFGLLNPLIRLFMPRMVKRLRVWDYAAAHRPDFLIANSKTVQARIKKYYKRESRVINPPVQVAKFKTNQVEKAKEGGYYLVVSRLVPYKRIDLAVKACSKTGRPLIVAGKGPELNNLKKIAGKSVTFIENPDEKKVIELYHGAKAFIFSADEDFGITPVEAMAAGLPVICFGHGGATETVINGKTGVYHDKQTVESLLGAIEKFEASNFSHSEIINRALEFSEAKFLESLGGFVLEKIKNK
jgi:glycosyltransferase involved in cell wall biosynthesis